MIRYHSILRKMRKGKIKDSMHQKWLNAPLWLILVSIFALYHTSRFLSFAFYATPNNILLQHRWEAEEEAAVGPSDMTPRQLRTTTDTGVAVYDPALKEVVDVHGDSSTATVAAQATGYPLEVHQRFVGSLRHSGYRGHILLMTEANLPPEIERYFRYRNVSWSGTEMVDCDDTVQARILLKGTGMDDEQCVKEFPGFKGRWLRHHILRNMLRSCETCTGPVLYGDIRDMMFQRDPFGPDSKPVAGLQVFEEGLADGDNGRTTFGLAAKPMLECIRVTYDEREVNAGGVIGTRAAMLKFWVRKSSETSSVIGNWKLSSAYIASFLSVYIPGGHVCRASSLGEDRVYI